MATFSGGDFVDPAAFYPPEYGAFQPAARVSAEGVSSPDAQRKPPPLLRHVAVSRMSWVSRVPGHPGLRALELGCGAGRIALALESSFDWDVDGIEPNLNATENARLAGLKVHHGTLDDFEGSAEYDCVILLHVLEHLPDPVRTLEQARKLLRPDGHVAIGVPNADSLERRLFGRSWDGWDIPRHVHHFNARSLRAALSRAGFVSGSVSYEWYSLLARGLANAFLGHLPYAERQGRLRSKPLERLWGLSLASLRLSSAIQIVARLRRSDDSSSRSA